MTRVSFLGPRGTFSEAALWHILKTSTLPDLATVTASTTVPLSTPGEALRAVTTGEVDYALVPTENFVDGPVTTTLDALAEESGLQIYAETEVPIVFSLLVKPGVTLEDLQQLGEQGEEVTVGSHPIALTQVRRWLEEHLPHATTITMNSTADAAAAVQRGEIDVAVAPARAGELYELDDIAHGVADVSGAYTRFILVGPPGPPPPPTVRDRTCVIFRLPNEPGTLVNALNECGLRGVDLLRIESRPTREVFGTYTFYVECCGHIQDAAVAEALQALYRRSTWIRFLGSWPIYRPQGTPPLSIEESVEWVERLRKGDHG